MAVHRQPEGRDVDLGREERPVPTHVEPIVGRESDPSNTSNGVSNNGRRVRCRISAPFSGKAVVIDRSSGPPGSGSLIVLSASAGSGASASVAAPAVPRNSRRNAKGCACRARSVISIIASPGSGARYSPFRDIKARTHAQRNGRIAHLRCNNFKQPMTAVGQFRHFERPLGMSALPPIATKNGEPLKRRRRARSRRRAAARERQAPRRRPRAASGVAGGAFCR